MGTSQTYQCISDVSIPSSTGSGDGVAVMRLRKRLDMKVKAVFLDPEYMLEDQRMHKKDGDIFRLIYT